MGFFRFLFKWSLQITGSCIVGYNYVLKPEQQADLYGFYRSCHNSYRAAKQVYAVINEYKGLLPLKENPQQYKRQLTEVNINTAKRLEELSRINKGVYMRLGQYVGHLKQALPTEFYEVLKDLNKKPNYQPEDYKYLKKHIERQLGKTTKQLFESLNTSPIKTELFHQVYKGQLAENFLDINMKVMHPYASAEAKYDFWFLRKVFDYINDFKNKNFTENYPLYLDLLYNNLKQSVEKQLSFSEQQKAIVDIKQKLNELGEQQKSKINNRALPVYVPHIYHQYTKQKVMIQQYFEGYHLSNSDALLKENFNRKTIASDLIGIWNGLFENNKIILDSYTPFDLFIRKSRANEQGPYQLCLLNPIQSLNLPEFFIQPYMTLWKEFVSGKKINPKKPDQRINSIRTFYENLPQVYFSLFLNEKDQVKQLLQKVKLPQISSNSASQLLQLSKSEVSKEVIKKLEEKKILAASKTKQLFSVGESIQREYDNLRRAFEIEYQPWKLECLFQTYKQIFREQKHFGAF